MYGMAYLHHTAWFTEHVWRCRLSHRERVRAGAVRLPATLCTTTALRKHNGGADGAAVGVEDWSRQARGVDPTDQNKERPAAPGSGTEKEGHAQKLVVSNSAALDAAMADAPSADMRLGVRVLVNDDMVPDHYPGLHSLPQCTATRSVSEATHSWVMVPFVLVSFLNHVMLDLIAIYRTLSLSFVLYMLHYKSGRAKAAATPQRTRAASCRDGANADTTTAATTAAAAPVPDECAPDSDDARTLSEIVEAVHNTCIPFFHPYYVRERLCVLIKQEVTRCVSSLLVAFTSTTLHEIMITSTFQYMTRRCDVRHLFVHNRVVGSVCCTNYHSVVTTR